MTISITLTKQKTVEDFPIQKVDSLEFYACVVNADDIWDLSKYPYLFRGSTIIFDRGILREVEKWLWPASLQDIQVYNCDVKGNPQGMWDEFI